MNACYYWLCHIVCSNECGNPIRFIYLSIWRCKIYYWEITCAVHVVQLSAKNAHYVTQTCVPKYYGSQIIFTFLPIININNNSNIKILESMIRNWQNINKAYASRHLFQMCKFIIYFRYTVHLNYVKWARNFAFILREETLMKQQQQQNKITIWS